MKATMVLAHMVWAWMEVFITLIGLSWVLSNNPGWLPLTVFGFGCTLAGAHIVVFTVHLIYGD
jgi:hypothetical protein